jgi:hypothetical protein
MFDESGNRRAEPRPFDVVPRAVSRAKNTPLTVSCLAFFWLFNRS